ncbi:MAG TPA: pitrilysin family protein, partial [Chthoniobacteraceae bacterium]
MLESPFQRSSAIPPGTVQFPPTTARTYTLPNGLGIIVQEDHSAPVASVQAWVETGSIHEDRHLGAGLSHILEHMLFKGTEKRGASEFAQTVQDAGGYINAYTSFDRTVYWIDIPSKGVNTALELLADAMMNSTLPSDEYVKEQEVIRREFAMGNDDPDRVASHALFDTAYQQHPYRHPVIGHFDVFNGLTRDDVMAYYKARYIPNNIFFVITGDVDPEKVRAQLAEAFTGYPRKSLLPVYIPAEPPQIGRREAHHEFATELTRLHVAWHVPALTHPDIPALDLLGTILGGGRSSRLYLRLREELKLVHSIDAWCYAPAHPGLFGVDAILDPEHRDAVQETVFAMLAEIVANGVTQAELDKAKKLALSHQLHALTTMRGKANDLGANWLL